MFFPIARKSHVMLDKHLCLIVRYAEIILCQNNLSTLCLSETFFISVNVSHYIQTLLMAIYFLFSWQFIITEYEVQIKRGKEGCLRTIFRKKWDSHIQKTTGKFKLRRNVLRTNSTFLSRVLTHVALKVTAHSFNKKGVFLCKNSHL